jgi:hypothetical protein
MSNNLIFGGICMGAGAVFALLPKATRNLVLGSAAVGVGAAAVVISVKSYYYRQTVHEILQEKRSKIIEPNHFIIDRIIDGNCVGKPLFIGIHKYPIESNSVSSQGIRLGEDGEIKRLISFKQEPSELVYRFEDSTSLLFSVKDGINTYTYISPTQKVVDKKVDIDKYKTIGMDCSAEFDYLKVTTNNSYSKLQ